MTSTNAPQPTPGADVAEVFDDTVQQAPPTVSADGGVGPNNIEAPIHAGSVNTFDSKYYTHWMSLTHIIWDTTAAPGQLLWSTPIHPDKSHQWLSWDAKKYNVWAGGFDFSVKVAGTGFHAGAVMLVRIPPGFSPDSFRTVNDLTAFDWKQIDPKTLEVVSVGIMDQRPVMYHYFPLDLSNRNSYGGHFAIYVLLPLRTSATGVTQISLQVFTRPSRNFTMDQLIPIRTKDPVITKPVSLEYALDFTQERTGSTFTSKLTGFTAWTQKSKVFLASETLNSSNFDGKPMNGEFQPRLQNVEFFRWAEPEKRISGLSNDWFIWRLEEFGSLKRVTITAKDKNKPVIHVDKLYYDSSDPTKYYPNVSGGEGTVTFTWKKETTGSTPVAEVFNVKFLKLTDDQKAKGNTVIMEVQDMELEDSAHIHMLGISTVVPAPEDGSDVFSKDNLKWLISAGIQYTKVEWEIAYTNYAPPITESIITFQSENGDFAQPFELTEVLKSKQYQNLIGPNESLIFELWDEIADLPILPIKLAYSGLITTLPQTTDRVFKFDEPERYKMYYIGTQPTTTPLSANKQLNTVRKYTANLRASTAIFQRRRL